MLEAFAASGMTQSEFAAALGTSRAGCQHISPAKVMPGADLLVAMERLGGLDR